jgi:hypothetical protein
MRIQLRRPQLSAQSAGAFSLDSKLAAYLAASASIGAVAASEAQAIVVSNSTVQPFGINGAVNIDFNSDGQTDFQIDHDRVDLTAQGGPVVDYLQLDKNDKNGASPGESLFVYDGFSGFPVNGTIANDSANMGYLVQNVGSASSVEYPTALLAGAEIGVNNNFDFQEGDNVQSTTKSGHFNRLIDEDHGQTDIKLNGKTADQVLAATNTPQFTGVQGQVRYLGVKLDLNNANPDPPAVSSTDPFGYTYGWIGIRITNEADATGEVVGYGWESTPGTSILAGATAPGVTGDYNNDGKVDAADYVLWRNGGPLQNEGATAGTVTAEDYTVWRANFGNAAGSGGALGTSAAVPEPGSLLLSALTGLGLIATYFFRRVRGR